MAHRIHISAACIGLWVLFIGLCANGQTTGIRPTTMTFVNPKIEKNLFGGTKSQYSTDGQNHKNGAYQKLFRDGKIEVVGQFDNDQPSGVWTTYDEAGRVVQKITFAKDIADGPSTWIDPTTLASVKAIYHNGGLYGNVTVREEDGKTSYQVNYPHSMKDIADTWEKLFPKTYVPVHFLEEPSVSPYRAGTVADDSLQEALKITKLFRYLSNVSGPELILDKSFNEMSQHGAVLLTKLQTLTHYPGKPSDMDADFFKLAYRGCSEDNLAEGFDNFPAALARLLGDGGANNAGEVGHRRWMLWPPLQKVGYGIYKNFMSQHIVQPNLTNPYLKPFSVIAYPGEGYYPRQLVTLDAPWSASFPKARLPSGAGVSVHMSRLDSHFQPVADIPVHLNNIVTDDYEGWTVVIFMPNMEAEEVTPYFRREADKPRGMFEITFQTYPVGKYLINITGPKPAHGSGFNFSYVVDLFDLDQINATQPPPDPAASTRPTTRPATQKALTNSSHHLQLQSAPPPAAWNFAFTGQCSEESLAFSRHGQPQPS